MYHQKMLDDILIQRFFFFISYFLVVINKKKCFTLLLKICFIFCICIILVKELLAALVKNMQLIIKYEIVAYFGQELTKNKLINRNLLKLKI